MVDKPVIRPRWLVEDVRMRELREGIHKVLGDNYAIPIEWIKEYNELMERSKNRKK